VKLNSYIDSHTFTPRFDLVVGLLDYFVGVIGTGREIVLRRGIEADSLADLSIKV
jgi:hypothetical protein